MPWGHLHIRKSWSQDLKEILRLKIVNNSCYYSLSIKIQYSYLWLLTFLLIRHVRWFSLQHFWFRLIQLMCNCSWLVTKLSATKRTAQAYTTYAVPCSTRMWLHAAALQHGWACWNLRLGRERGRREGSDGEGKREVRWGDELQIRIEFRVGNALKLISFCVTIRPKWGFGPSQENRSLFQSHVFSLSLVPLTALFTSTCAGTWIWRSAVLQRTKGYYTPADLCCGTWSSWSLTPSFLS